MVYYATLLLCGVVKYCCSSRVFMNHAWPGWAAAEELLQRTCTPSNPRKWSRPRLPMHLTSSDRKMASEYTLHVFPFSLYSIMARLTNVLGRITGPEDGAPAINYKLINLHRDEQITPEYLKLNPKGQVCPRKSARLFQLLNLLTRYRS